MQKFNNNNITTGYIKELLHSFNLPQYKVLKAGITLFPNNVYIYKNQIYLFTGKAITKLSDDLTTLPIALKNISTYIYGQNILNNTRNLNISSPFYDSYTHKYLGDYLRFHRDYFNINLMSMYNCFSNEMPQLLNIKTDKFTFTVTDSGHKIYIIPIKFFQEYTIAIDCDTTIEVVAGFYSNGEFIIDSVATQNDFYEKTYLKKVSSRFKKPFIYSKLSTVVPSSLQYSLEKHLVLYLKVPYSCKSSIAVLEGNYQANTEHYFEDGVEKLSNVPLIYTPKDVDDIKLEDTRVFDYTSRLQLLNFNSNISYPFADRLLEYLFNNVVDSTEEIGENIERIQNILLKLKPDKGIKLAHIKKYGEWSDEIRKVLYENSISFGLIHKTFDSIGYYDKDIEEVLGD